MAALIVGPCRSRVWVASLAQVKRLTSQSQVPTRHVTRGSCGATRWTSSGRNCLCPICVATNTRLLKGTLTSPNTSSFVALRNRSQTPSESRRLFIKQKRQRFKSDQRLPATRCSGQHFCLLV
jgi:hypothetical protein